MLHQKQNNNDNYKYIETNNDKQTKDDRKI